MKRVLCGILFLGSLLLFQPVIFSQSKEEIEEQVRELFTEGRAHLDKDEYLKAYEKFEQALRLKPEASLIAFYRDELGEKYLTEMLALPELRDTALRIMELAKGGIIPWERTPEQIEALVVALDTDVFDNKWTVLNKLVAVGQRACPQLIPRLGDVINDRLRANVIHTLGKLGREAVLPVIEALNSSNLLMRQNAAIILGTIRDERAVPELKRLYEDPNESPEVKTYIADAIQKITGQGVEILPSAKELYYKLAEKYYYNRPSIMVNLYGTYLVWRWDKETDKLTQREVPEFSFNEELAEECCYDVLALDENYEPIIPLLICIYLAQYNEGEIALRSAQAKADAGVIPQEVFNELQADLAVINQGLLFGAMATRKYLYQALQRLLKDDNIEVSVSCIKALRACARADNLPLMPLEMPSEESLKSMKPEQRSVWELKKAQWEQENRRRIGGPLVKALSNDDKRIRYAAAECLMKIAPRQKYPEAEKVIPVIIDALGESGIRLVLIIDDDINTRNQLKKELRKLNCYPIEAMTGEDGLAKAKQFPSEDLIIIKAKIANHIIFSVDVLEKEYSETVFDSLKADIRTKAIPRFILTEPERLESVKAAFSEEPVQAYLTKPIDRIILKDELDKVFGSEKVQQDSKSRAEAVARLAAEALANLELIDCIYPYQETIDELITSLENRPDIIKLPVLKALERFGDFRAISSLGKVFHNQENTKEIRIAAGRAISEIFKVNPDFIPEDTFFVLKEGIQEADFDIQSIVATALGNAKLTPAQRKELFELKRLHPK